MYIVRQYSIEISIEYPEWFNEANLKITGISLSFLKRNFPFFVMKTNSLAVVIFIYLFIYFFFVNLI